MSSCSHLMSQQLQHLSHSYLNKVSKYVIGFPLKKYLPVLLTSHKGHTGEYWPKVTTEQKKHSKVFTMKAKGQYSQLLLKQASLVHVLSSLLIKK